ncbi:hypothetical protein H4O09_13530 [Stenotrophomonas sp. W1S232]|uniref:Lipoprotein n=1 Tax=Stenotrophomonas koreensis TaxID=266128 RepID=A0A7W3V232_9GAMM|nr:hypothetical protein [Stenotrophomonas koreensis]MBB1118073.1 hypothetical protein [Stenotrophomonas koreensis]
MRRMTTSCLLASGLALLSCVSAAQACSILDMEGPENKFNNSDTLLLAQPISTILEPLPDGSGLWPRDYRQHVVWEVVKVWKGSAKVGDRFEQTRWIKQVAGHCSAYEVAEEGQRVVFYSKHPPQLSRYYHNQRGQVNLLP